MIRPIRLRGRFLAAAACLGAAALFLRSVPLAAQDDRTAAVDEILASEATEDGPGLAVVVLTDGVVDYRKTCGLADVENKVPVGPQTRFNLASCSKQFTALAVMILADRGKLDYEDDAREYLPELPRYDPARPVRVSDLLHMTAGIPINYADFDDYESMTNEEIFKLLVQRPRVYPTGTRHEYSNMCYILLGMIVERVAKTSLGEFLHAEVFEPAGMKHTVLRMKADQQIPDRAKGYEVDEKGCRPDNLEISLYGHSHVFSTLDDMALYEAALHAGRFVKPETWRLAFTPGKLDSGEPHEYGFGWEPGGQEGHRRVVHTGAWYGFRSAYYRFLDSGVAVIVLSNDGNKDAGDVAARISKVWHEETEAGRKDD